MATCKGTPNYTQHTDDLTGMMDDRIVAEITVSFDDKDGGTNGEFKFAWYDLGSRTDAFGKSTPLYPHGALKVECFTDGLTAMMDDRIVAVLNHIRKHNHNAAPASVIAYLEENGVVQSKYHLRGGR